jgi:hypothetical protein
MIFIFALRYFFWDFHSTRFVEVSKQPTLVQPGLPSVCRELKTHAPLLLKFYWSILGILFIAIKVHMLESIY